jgi:hypothetical protein
MKFVAIFGFVLAIVCLTGAMPQSDSDSNNTENIQRPNPLGDALRYEY